MAHKWPPKHKAPSPEELQRAVRALRKAESSPLLPKSYKLSTGFPVNTGMNLKNTFGWLFDKSKESK